MTNLDNPQAVADELRRRGLPDCPECRNPPGHLHQDACSRVHSEDFVGVPWGTIGEPGVIHLFTAESDTAVCCGKRQSAVPHSEQSTLEAEWATCPRLGQG